MSYEDDMTLLTICLREGDKDDAGLLVRQIIRRYPVRMWRLRLGAWIEGDRAFLDHWAQMKELMNREEGSWDV